jgi:hypothetical protein
LADDVVEEVDEAVVEVLGLAGLEDVEVAEWVGEAVDVDVVVVVEEPNSRTSYL